LESPRLLELAEGLPPLVIALVDARNRESSAYKAAMAEWPDVPDPLVSYPPKGFLGCHDHERDVAGGARPGGKHVSGSSFHRSRIEGFEQDLTRKVVIKSESRTKQLRGLIQDAKKEFRLAVAYEKECARIKAKSGYETASDAHSGARKALHNQVNAIMAEPEKTMVGVLIKAQALDAWNKVDHFHRTFNIQGPEWAEAMAHAVLRQGARAA